jgi:hypothetical protein
MISDILNIIVLLLLNLQFSSNSSGPSKGGDWTKTLYFTPDAKNPGSSPAEVSDNDLKSHFAEVEGTEEDIVRVDIFKSNLKPYIPKLCGAWHEFIVVESKSWYWSFEKDSKGIRVQRGKTLKSVKEYYRGEKRPGTVKPEGRDFQLGQGDKIQDIFIWIYRKDYLNHSYHVTKSNCHYFASLLFEAIARQKGRQLHVKRVDL